jgi:hypothetical protein
METAAAHLAPLAKSPVKGDLRLHLLTGERFWWQTAFCLRSFGLAAAQAVSVEIYDDGTLRSEHRAALERLGLSLRFHAPEELREKLETHLPTAKFPVLRERWQHYPHIRKLIDVHLASTGWKLVLDSDLLFFRRPDFLLSWLQNPLVPLHGVDCVESYGYSRGLLDQLTECPVPVRLNVGVCGLLSEELDWERIERWCSLLIEKERTNYYLEQAIVALHLAGRSCAVAPDSDYVTLPSAGEIKHPTAVMHHYVDTAKRGYYRHAWRRFAL